MKLRCSKIKCNTVHKPQNRGYAKSAKIHENSNRENCKISEKSKREKCKKLAKIQTAKIAKISKNSNRENCKKLHNSKL